MSTSLPELPGLVVHRPRLSQLLDGAMGRAVTLLTAPPGWGKTVALRSWLDERGSMSFLSLEATDPARLSERLAAIAPEAADDGIAGPAGNSAGDGTAGGGKVDVVVIDGLDADPVAVSAITDLLRRTAGRVRVVLATRDDAALPVPQWRLLDQVTEIGCGELGFTMDETTRLLAAHGVTLPSPELDDLHTRTEGWPAGVRFAALHADAPDPLISEQRDVGRYLETEWLAGLPDRTRDLLRRTSVLDRVSGDFAGALTGADPRGAEADLEQLSAAGGFVLTLGGSPVWYRYHRQFRDALRSELARTDEAGELHSRAATWLSLRGMTAEAIQHAWASGDRGQVASYGEAPWADLALAGCHRGADRDRVPTAACADPALALAYTVDRLGHGDATAAESGLELMARSGQSTMAIRALRLATDRIRGDLAAIDSSATAVLEVAENPAEPAYAEVRAVAIAAQAAGMLGAGDLAGAADALGEPRPAADEPICSQRTTSGVRALTLALTGALRDAERAARAALALPPCPGQPRDVHGEPAYLALALVSHEWDRAAEADRYFELAGRSARLTVEPELGGWAALIGTWMRSARGDLAGAFESLAAGRAASFGSGPPVRLEPWFTAAEAELRISRGDTATARATLTPLLADDSVADAALSVLLARALLRDGDPHAAARALPTWSDDEKSDAVLSVRLDAGLVDAQVARTLGDRRRAADTLERVLDLAEPQGFRRPFSKDADAVRDLLADQLDSGTAHWSTVSALVGQPPGHPSAEATPTGEALTEREVTVLRYLQSMLSNEEIAAKLFVSLNTVKTHVRHIYRKLDVSHRRDAVRRGRDLRVL